MSSDEESENQLESELDSVKAQLQEMKERCFSAETNLQDCQQLFKTELKELKDKAQMLSTALEREMECKSDLQDELDKVHAELERGRQEHGEARVSGDARERNLSQQLSETLQSNAVLSSDLKNARSAHKNNCCGNSISTGVQTREGKICGRPFTSPPTETIWWKTLYLFALVPTGRVSSSRTLVWSP